MSVGELVAAVGAPQPRVSTHLAALRWCGFVTSLREHRTVRYRIADDRVLGLVPAPRGVVADPPAVAGAVRTVAPHPPAADRPPPADVAAAPGLHVVFEL